MDTVLYDYWRSSASYRVRIALNLAAIPYRAVHVDLVKGDHKSAAHLARNPQGLLPVLEIDGHTFTQSLAMIEYIDQTRGLGLVPTDPVAAAQARALAYAIAVDVHPVCNVSVANYAAALTDEADVARGAWMVRFITPGLVAFEALLKAYEQAPYCTGDQVGLADICLIAQLYNARRWKVDFSGLRRIAGVAAACHDHPAFAAATPEAVHGAAD